MTCLSLKEIIRAHKTGKKVGITSICSANRFVLEACMLQAKQDGSLLLVESTCNQVNQYGGYMGLTPEAFVGYVRDIAADCDLDPIQIMLGGDHLGPNPWQREPARSAMRKATELIRSYVTAGFRKIHLDTSMRCSDDWGEPFTAMADEIVAERAADLCLIAETACQTKQKVDKPCYVIGTEVPVPGGAHEPLSGLTVTGISGLRKTISTTRQAFLERGLDEAWDRVIAVVVQPGVEFDDQQVVDYRRDKARALSLAIEKYPDFVYEAHSTDYQNGTALRQLVEDHFAILKVGPGLTFAAREALFALADMEREWLTPKQHQLSGLKGTLDKAMLQQTEHWEEHYRGDDARVAFARKYSYSDRARYYWTHPAVVASVNRLLQNLTANPVPQTLLSQYLPNQYRAVRDGLIADAPAELVRHRIREVLALYSRACGLQD
jgi:D-tagatose-1,6-bisphosphate aldolase subunit GatZ/KbaZ